METQQRMMERESGMEEQQEGLTQKEEDVSIEGSGRVAPELAEDSDCHSDAEHYEKYDDDDDNMLLAEDEYDWALRIKEIIAEDPELKEGPRLSDMMIAQIALVSMADEELEHNEDADMSERVKERVRGLQRVHHDFEVVESLESAKALLSRWVQDLVPGFALSFHFDEARGSYVLVLDLTNLDMRIFSDPDQHLLAIKGLYYLYQCMNADLSATRCGMISLCECEGYFWKSKNMPQVKAFEAWAELASGYPLHFTSIMHFHTGIFMNLVTSVAKKLVPPGVAKKFQFGAKSEQRLDQLYLQPSLEAANQRLLVRLHEALELRFHNEAVFVLEE